jgi:DNA-binding cell septation regulator SpoVG
MADRFEFRGKYAMRKQNKGKVIAYFNVVDTEIGIEFRDVRLIEGKNGVFVAAPFRTYKDKEDKDAFSDFWRAAYNEQEEARDERGVAYLEEMAKAAYAFYQTLDGSASNSGGGSSRNSSNSGGTERRSARGPVPTTGSSDNAGKTGAKLPF